MPCSLPGASWTKTWATKGGLVTLLTVMPGALITALRRLGLAAPYTTTVDRQRTRRHDVLHPGGREGRVGQRRHDTRISEILCADDARVNVCGGCAQEDTCRSMMASWRSCPPDATTWYAHGPKPTDIFSAKRSHERHERSAAARF